MAVLNFTFIVYSFFIMYKSLVRKNPDAIRMIFGFLVLMIAGVMDLIGSMGLIDNLENYGILKYGFLFLKLEWSLY
ncbi:7TM diverse intracellular signaling domain protein [Leptospira interrogans serovar Copenhageni str. LT2050]|uniref:7TM diverse intracellular signaling domain protein n=1 Tax=Leptospira interrogans serovar Copenhageni str. LT2050 TaxID=1001598 RepID=M3GEN8_LEPIT|nr:7TM diverse intracellular signaling domain protein [Leptospira interrogans serovar Copenhageni str. LT2050]